VSRYTIELVMSTSAPYGVWDNKDETFICQCDTEEKAIAVVRQLLDNIYNAPNKRGLESKL
jgi:GMP synthase-like glutamine amidotransferase